MNAQDAKELGEWLVSHQTGASSMTMAAIALGAETGRFDAPRDPSDFGRCYKLVKRLPKIRNHFETIAQRVPVFAGILREWDALCRIYERDLPTGKSDELYERIRSLREEVAGPQAACKSSYELSS